MPIQLFLVFFQFLEAFVVLLFFPPCGMEDHHSSSCPSLLKLSKGLRQFAVSAASPLAALQSSLPGSTKSSPPAVTHSSLPADPLSSLLAVHLSCPPATHQSSSRAAARSSPPAIPMSSLPAGAPSTPAGRSEV